MKLLSELPRAALTTKSSRSSTAELGPDSPLQFLKGIGPKRAELFEKLGLKNVEDLLYHFPFRFEDRRRIFSPSELQGVTEGSLVCVAAKIESVREFRRGRSRESMIDLRASDGEGGELQCLWFRSYKGQTARLRELSQVVFTGTLSFQGHRPQIVHPDVEAGQGETSLNWGRIVPIYPTTSGLSQRMLRLAVHNALELVADKLSETIPQVIREAMDFPKLADSLRQVHFPDALPRNDGRLSPEFRRFAFTEFFQYLISQNLSRKLREVRLGSAVPIRNRLALKVRERLPFQLTEGQERALAEIRNGIQKNVPMNRILQGDVGSGKTIVALLALADAIDGGFQGALVVPTETLAEQHFRSAQRWFAGTGIEPLLLTGSLTKAEKEAAHKKIASTGAKLVIGTHALFQPSVDWPALGLVVIDEQHRFGVRQRLGLQEKAKGKPEPHLLTMTATPIPRSLALTIFGDLEISVIPAPPQGRLPIATKVIPGADRQKVYNLCQREVRNGHQCFLIYPLVENSEAEGLEAVRSVEADFERLKTGPLRNLRLTMIHGRLSAEDRQERMRAFEKKEFDVLLATTVIEVGIDVPNATVIVIEHAERFGLAQLHQLRGRVGRGNAQSYCCLVTDEPGGPRKTATGETQPKADFYSEEAIAIGQAWERLQVLEKSTDGFEIAEADLRIRGPGDFLGHRQSGAPTFRIGNLVRDRELFEQARRSAEELLERDPELRQGENQGLRRRWLETHAKLADTLRSG